MMSDFYLLADTIDGEYSNGHHRAKGGELMWVADLSAEANAALSNEAKAAIAFAAFEAKGYFTPEQAQRRSLATDIRWEVECSTYNGFVVLPAGTCFLAWEYGEAEPLTPCYCHGCEDRKKKAAA